MSSNLGGARGAGGERLSHEIIYRLAPLLASKCICKLFFWILIKEQSQIFYLQRYLVIIRACNFQHSLKYWSITVLSSSAEKREFMLEQDESKLPGIQSRAFALVRYLVKIKIYSSILSMAENDAETLPYR